jgi:hypothetical protein
MRWAAHTSLIQLNYWRNNRYKRQDNRRRVLLGEFICASRWLSRMVSNSNRTLVRHIIEVLDECHNFRLPTNRTKGDPAPGWLDVRLQTLIRGFFCTLYITLKRALVDSEKPAMETRSGESRRIKRVRSGTLNANYPYALALFLICSTALQCRNTKHMRRPRKRALALPACNA